MALNSVTHIINKNLTLEDKIKIKILGPPRPDLHICQDDKKKGTVYVRKFNNCMYNSAKWICGCDQRNAFYCFTCILINPNSSDTAWTKKGVTELKHLGEKVKKHKATQSHLNNAIEFATLEQDNIKLQLESTRRLATSAKQTRIVLNKMIDSLKFCCAFEFVSRSNHSEILHESIHPGVVKAFQNLLSEVDFILKDHFRNNNTFLDYSNTIQNNILDAILSVCRDLIKDEIEDTQFLSIQAEEITDFASKKQLVIIYRYALNGKIHERLWGCFAPDNYTCGGLSFTILEQFKSINIDKTPYKLISQSYDGATLMNCENSYIQTVIKDTYKDVNFINSYAHPFNILIEKVVSQKQRVKIFFANIYGFSTYFKCTSDIKDVIKKYVPKWSSVDWNCNIAIIKTIYMYKDNLIEYFEEMIDIETDYTIITNAIGLKNNLYDPDFIFWLNFFLQIMSNVEIFCNQLQQQKLAIVEVQTYILEFTKNIQIIRDEIDTNYDTKIPSSSSSKRQRIEYNNGTIAIQACDTIIKSAENRFKSSSHLAIAMLIDSDMFAEYQNTFPEHLYKIAINAYSFLKSAKLKQELMVLYAREEFCTFTISSLWQFFSEENIQDAFSETVKLIKIVCTIPMPTAESARKFSTLKKIRTYLKKSLSQERLSAMLMCSMEADMIQNTANFNDLVIEHFLNHTEKSRVDELLNPVSSETVSKGIKPLSVMDSHQFLNDDGNKTRSRIFPILSSPIVHFPSDSPIQHLKKDEQKHIEERIESLKNIQGLLDTSILMIQHCNTSTQLANETSAPTTENFVDSATCGLDNSKLDGPEYPLHCVKVEELSSMSLERIISPSTSLFSLETVKEEHS